MLHAKSQNPIKLNDQADSGVELIVIGVALDNARLLWCIPSHPRYLLRLWQLTRLVDLLTRIVHVYLELLTAFVHQHQIGIVGDRHCRLY